MIAGSITFARFLFGDTRMAWFWLVVRLFLGYQWLDAASHKLVDPKWTQTGDAQYMDNMLKYQAENLLNCLSEPCVTVSRRACHFAEPTVVFSS